MIAFSSCTTSAALPVSMRIAPRLGVPKEISSFVLPLGAAATPQIGLIISITLLTSMGLPLEATALVAGVYRIIDQAHTSTNASGDLVTSVCIASMEGLLDRDRFNDLNEIPELDHKVSEELA